MNKVMITCMYRISLNKSPGVYFFKENFSKAFYLKRAFIQDRHLYSPFTDHLCLYIKFSSCYYLLIDLAQATAPSFNVTTLYLRPGNLKVLYNVDKNIHVFSVCIDIIDYVYVVYIIYGVCHTQASI